nr:grasp-with-spasm system ATP-grasp peptide maturase [uncultured Brumimicrobium sp.]
MILIISEQEDYSTERVTKWLDHLHAKYFRLNKEDPIKNLEITFSNNDFSINLYINEEWLLFKEIHSVWYRRGELNFDFDLTFTKNATDSFVKGVQYNLIHEELKTINDFMEHVLINKPSLGSMKWKNANKLLSLLYAQRAELEVPKSIISTEKKQLKTFFKESKKDCISKGVQDVMSFVSDNNSYSYATSKILSKDIEDMSETFFPSLLQHNIDKKYEVRTFYLNGDFYSMAIFSQNDEKTSVDYRNYNVQKPNRNVPYLLPKKIEDKLTVFMNSMELNTGSIDLIVTNNNEFVFLEVNPSGQYGMVSIPCDYELDFKIAKHLISLK